MLLIVLFVLVIFNISLCSMFGSPHDATYKTVLISSSLVSVFHFFFFVKSVKVFFLKYNIS